MLGVSLEQKVSLTLTLPAVVLLALTLAETYWFQTREAEGYQVHMGLWKICGHLGTDDCFSLNGSPDWIAGPEVLECVGLSCALAAVALSFRMIFHKTKLRCLLAASLACLAGLFSLVGALVFHKKMEGSEAGWCFYLTLVSSVLCLAGGAALCLHLGLVAWGYRSI